MKTLINLLVAGLIVGFVPRAFADDRSSVSGIFYVITVNGKVECTADGRIWDLKKGDQVLGRGTKIKTDKDANVTVMFSNQTVMFIDEKTELRIKRFDQEPFTPNNNLGIEPSNSETLINLFEGELVLNTPQLLSGTHLIFETPHAQISVLNVQSGNEKAYIEVNEKQTHVAVIAGKVSVKPRQSDGSYVSLGSPVETNHQAIVKTVLGSDAGSAVQTTSGAEVKSKAETAARGALGELSVGSVDGTVEWSFGGPGAAPKKGDHRSAAGVTVRTGEKSGATFVLANGTSLALAPKTELKIDQFDQTAFSPSTDPAMEPSNSQTHITLRSGQLGISAPMLKVGSHLVFETPHSAISFLNNQPTVGQAFIDVDAKQTHFQLIQGKASVQPRDAEGNWSMSFPTLKGGQQAFIKYTMPAEPEKKPEKGGAAAFNPITSARAASTVVIAPVPIIAEGVNIVSRAGTAEVLRTVGAPEAQLPDRAPVPLEKGAELSPGTIVRTGPDSEIFLKTFEGAIAVIHPNSVVRIDDLGIATAGKAVLHQSARLNLRDGSIDSFIDPRGRNINDYAVVTPDGVATAHGTGFNTTVSPERSLVATTADNVSYHSSTGADYPIQAGAALIGSRDGTAPLPLSLAQAIAGHHELIAAAETAVSGISTVVGDDVGNLATNSAINLIAQAVGAACAGSPTEAVKFIRESIGSTITPNSAVQSNVRGAITAIVIAAVKAVPDQAAQLAAAATDVAPDYAAAIASAAGSAAPDSASTIASSVAQVVIQHAPKSNASAVLTDITNAVSQGIAAAAADSGTKLASNLKTTQSTSIVITDSTGNEGDTVASTVTSSSGSNLSTNFGSNFSNTEGPANQTNNLPSTSLIITQLNGGQMQNIANTLDLTQTAQSTVTFSTATTSNGTTIVTVTPTVSSNLPVNFTTSESVLR